MQLNRIHQEFRIALGFLPYIKKPLTLDQAIAEVQLRQNNRERNFLDVCKKLIYENEQNPFRKLLLWAGCDYSDLEKSIDTCGLERTLEKLRDHEVYLTLEEFKLQRPICRNGLTLEPTAADFDNPRLLPKGIQASTSGTASKSTRVLYDWDFFAEEASNEMLLNEVHGLSTMPCAFWLPSLPSISGLHNLFLHLRFRQSPQKWFSQLQPDFQSQLKLSYVARVGRLFGVKVPHPEYTVMDHAIRVAQWIQEKLNEHGRCYIKTFASSAVRIAQAALKKGIDLSGCLMFTGGEPLTERRYKFLQLAGVQAFPRYVATETGLIAGGCKYAEDPDSMHVYTDRIALIQRERTTVKGSYDVNAILLTTLSCNSPKILLNTELGDHGVLRTKSCDCLFGKLGMNQIVSEVRSFDKFTGEGMTLLGSVLDEVIAELVQNAGGGPDDYQFMENHNEEGFFKLAIRISPHVKITDENYFANMILEQLREKDAGAKIASHFWHQANTLQIIRESPQITGGFKMLPIVKSKV